MHIKILGTRGEIKESAPYHSQHSGMLLDDLLMFDCGEPSFLKYKPEAIFITHLHPDHAFFVRRGYIMNWDILTMPWYAPETFRKRGIALHNPLVIEGYEITPIPTIHSTKVLSQAYSIVKNGKKIVYTGDMIWIEKQYHHLLEGSDLIITEASYMRKGGLVRKHAVTGALYGHTGVPNLIHLFQHYTKKMLFMHFGAWFYKDMKKAHQQFHALAHEHGIEIIVGYDGLELS